MQVSIDPGISMHDYTGITHDFDCPNDSHPLGALRAGILPPSEHAFLLFFQEFLVVGDRVSQFLCGGDKTFQSVRFHFAGFDVRLVHHDGAQERPTFVFRKCDQPPHMAAHRIVDFVPICVACIGKLLVTYLANASIVSLVVKATE